jgi:hypothetical protein
MHPHRRSLYARSEYSAALRNCKSPQNQSRLRDSRCEWSRFPSDIMETCKRQKLYIALCDAAKQPRVKSLYTFLRTFCRALFERLESFKAIVN